MESSATDCTTQPASAEDRLRLGRRRLILIRHAKAVEEDVGGDHARGLSERGQADAAALGEWLAQQGLKPGQVLCSTARRTRETLGLAFARVPVVLSEKLYLATVGEMMTQLQAVDDAVQDVALISHNPGIHALLALLVGDYADEEDADRMLLKFPTAACAVVSFDAPRWSDVAPQRGRLELLRY